MILAELYEILLLLWQNIPGNGVLKLQMQVVSRSVPAVNLRSGTHWSTW